MQGSNATPEVLAYDTLYAGDLDIATDEVCLASGAGALKRGTVLGLIKRSVASTLAKPAGNTGTATIGSISLGVKSKTGNYVLTCTSVANHIGTFSVVDPEGDVIGNAIQGTAFADAQLNFTIAAVGGGTDTIVGDTFTIAVLQAAGSVTANGAGTAGANTAGSPSVGSIQPGVTAKAGNYVLKCVTKAGSSIFSVTDPNGVALPNATQGSAYTNAELSFLIASGGTSFEVGDGFKIAVTPQATAAVSTAVDGSQEIYAILLEDADATSAAVWAPIAKTGLFNEAALIFSGASDGPGTFREAARRIGIFFKTIHP